MTTGARPGRICWSRPTTSTANKFADKWGMAPVVFGNAQGQNTVVPMGQTFSVFFYRSDLVKPEEVPKTLARTRHRSSKKLQADGKVKFGYVGGMSMNNSWFSWFWSMWGNNCDVLMPPYERDNKKLAASRLEVGHDRAVHAADRRILVGCDQHPQDRRRAACRPTTATRPTPSSWPATPPSPWPNSLWWGTFNDPAKSKIAGKVAAARFPLGPNRTRAVRLGRHLGLGDPEVDRARAQEARQADAGRDDARRGRPDEAVQGDRRAAAQHRVLAEDRRRTIRS